jgi:LEA14-like dessication related protein
VRRRYSLPLILLLTGGCNVIHGPKVSVQGVSVTEATGEALGLTLRLELRNPNRVPVELYDFRYALYVAGHHVYEGRRAASATLGASSTRTIELPAVVPYDRLSWAEGELPATAAYELQGTLRYVAPNMLLQVILDAGKRRPGVGFSRSGEVETGHDKGTG